MTLFNNYVYIFIQLLTLVLSVGGIIYLNKKINSYNTRMQNTIKEFVSTIDTELTNIKTFVNYNQMFIDNKVVELDEENEETESEEYTEDTENKDENEDEEENGDGEDGEGEDGEDGEDIDGEDIDGETDEENEDGDEDGDETNEENEVENEDGDGETDEENEGENEDGDETNEENKGVGDIQVVELLPEQQLNESIENSQVQYNLKHIPELKQLVKQSNIQVSSSVLNKMKKNEIINLLENNDNV